MSKICSNCGKELKENQPVCLNCGMPISDAEIINEFNPGNPGIDSRAKYGFYLGLASLISWLFPIICYIIPAAGLILSISALPSKINHDKAIAGIIVSTVGIIILIAIIILSNILLSKIPDISALLNSLLSVK